MRTINCYFCQSELETHFNCNIECVKCAQDNQLRQVINTLDELNGRFIYAHIYPDDEWHIRLELNNNITCIKSKLVRGRIITLKGFPITLSNVKEKLKMCLLFQ
jgi:hypothetical protein